MKKKIIPVLALASVLGVGAASLASCGTKEKIVTEEKIVEVHHYGIDLLSTDEVTLKSESKSAVVGDTVKVSATVNSVAVSLHGITIEGVETTPVEGEENTWTFIMPDHTVRVSPKVSATQFAITVSNDDTSGTIKVYNSENEEITTSPAGQKIVIRHEAVNLAKRVKSVTANGTALTYSETLGGWECTVPAAALTIAVEYEDVTCNLTVTTNVLGDVITNPDLAFDFADVAIIYSLWNGDTKIEESDYAGSNTYNNLVPGTPISISTTDNMYSKNAYTLSKVTLNGENIPFTPGEDMGIGIIYTFEDPTFVVPSEDAELHFEFEVPDVVNATVEASNGAEVNLVDPDMGMGMPFYGGSLNKNETIMLDAFIPDGYALDDWTSGAYDAEGNLVGEWEVGEFGVTMTLTPSVDVRIVLNCVSALKKEGLTGSYVALEAINDPSTVKNSLTINEDYSFKFFYNGALSYAIEDYLTIPYEAGGAYTWESEDGKESLLITPHYEVKGTGEDANATFRWLNVTHHKNATTNHYVFTQGSFTTISHKVETSEGGILAYVSADFASYGAWVLGDEAGLREVTIKDAPYGEDSWEEDKIYDLVDGETSTQVQYGSSKLNYPGVERGSFTIPEEEDPVVLDGFGNYVRGALTGTYEIDLVKNTLVLNGTSGEKTKWNIDLAGHALSVYVPTKNEVSDVVYKFETVNTNIGYATKGTLSFVNSDEFSVKDNKDAEFGKSYTLDENTLTLVTKKGTTTFTLDPVTLTLTVTSKDGNIFANDGDLPVGTVLAPATLGRTFKTADGTTSITLKTDGTLGETTPYTLKVDGTKVTAETADNLYELDLVANTYKDITPQFDWAVFNGKMFKGTATLNAIDEGWNPISGESKVTITLNADATKADVSIHQEDPVLGNDPYDYEGTALAVTIDKQAKTITIALSETKNLVLNVNTKTNEITTTTASVKLNDTTGTEKEFGLEGLSLKEAVNYKGVVAGKTFGADVVWEYQDWNDPDNCKNVTNSVTVTFHATDNTADVKMDQETLEFMGSNTVVDIKAATYTISDTGLIDINLKNNYKHLKIQIGTDGSLKISGSSLKLTTSEGDIEFGLNNSVLTQK